MGKLLIPREKYLASGLHIGMKTVNEKMKEFIFKKRRDGLTIFNLEEMDRRIRLAARLIARKKRILVVGRKTIAHSAVKKFAEIINANYKIGRYIPGMLTNPRIENFYEADILVVTDPFSDRQAINDAVKARVPIIAICDSSNEIRDVDLIIPANNKGKKAIATLYWLLAREVLKERGEIKDYKEFKYKVEDFLSHLSEK